MGKLPGLLSLLQLLLTLMISQVLCQCNMYHRSVLVLKRTTSHYTHLVWCLAVKPELLAGDPSLDNLYANYNSVDVQVNVTIDNAAWYPDLGYVVKTNHNRLANSASSEGFRVVSTKA